MIIGKKDMKKGYVPPCKTADICSNYAEGVCTSEIGIDCRDLAEKLGESDSILKKRNFALSLRLVEEVKTSIANGNLHQLKILELCTSTYILDKDGNPILMAPRVSPWIRNYDIALLGETFLELAKEATAYNPLIRVFDFPTSTYFLRNNEEIAKFIKGRPVFSAGEAKQ